MSQQGYLVWYSNADIVIDKNLVVNLAQLVGAETVDFVSRYYQSGNPFDAESSEPPITDVQVAELGKYLRPGQVLSCDADSASLGPAIVCAIEKEIPEHIRGDFLPDRPFFSIGRHWWIDSDDSIAPVECKVSIGCWGYSTPNDCDAMQLACGELAIVQSVREQLESICPEVQLGMFWIF